MNHNFFKHVAPLALLAGLATTAGCASQSDTGAISTVTPQNAPPGARDHRMAPGPEGPGKIRGQGGPQMIFRVAMSELDLSAAQRSTLQGVIDGLRPPKHDEAGRPEIFAELADAVRAGKIDEATLQPKLDALAAEHQKDPAKIAAAFQTLHDTLTAEQRAKLVASMRERMAAREEEGSDRHVRRGADQDEARGPKGPRPFAPFLHGIELTDAQRAQIEQALTDAGMGKPDGKPRFEEMHTKMQQALDAFATDKFDAAAFVPTMAEGPRGHGDKLVKMLAAVTPVLDQAQRATLAANLEKGPMGHGKHGGPRPNDEPVDEKR